MHVSLNKTDKCLTIDELVLKDCNAQTDTDFTLYLSDLDNTPDFTFSDQAKDVLRSIFRNINGLMIRVIA